MAMNIKNKALPGIDGMFVWHSKGNAYGLIDGLNNIEATSKLFQWGRKYLTGILVSATSDNLAKWVENKIGEHTYPRL